MSFPKYEVYKDSGVEWMGAVPEHWEMSRVKFDSYVKARVGWHGLKSDEFTEEGPYLVTGSDFKNRTVDWSKCYHCTVERYDQDRYIQLREGDLLITKDGTIGKLILVEGIPGNATLNSGIFVVRPFHERYSTQFYFWLLQSSVFCDFISIHKTGSTISHLYQETFENLPYALPSRYEQLQISHFLDRETTRIDALIAEQQRLIELLKEKRQAVISHAVTKGLDRTAPMKDSGVEWLGEVPEHWEVSRLKHIAKIVDCKNRTPEYVDNGEYLVVRTSNVKEQKLNIDGAYYTDKEHFEIWTQRGIPPVGSILFTREAPTGEVCLVPEDINLCMGQRMMNIIPHDLTVTNFLFDYLTSDCLTRYIQSESAGSTVTHLRVEQVHNIPVVVPPPDEQVSIDTLVRDMKHQFTNLVELAKKSVDILQERRSALISAAVTGKIDVRNWQPSPEPTPAHGR